MRLPGQGSGRDTPDALRVELLHEMAASLAGASLRVERALAALTAATPVEREARLDAAGEAAWFLVVQREACGLRDGERVLDLLGVPGEVRLRMGVRRRPG